MPSSRTIAALLSRALQLPAWVILVQGFLAVGWLRAAAAHGMTSEWWTGEEVAAYALATDHDPVVYVEPILRQVVVPYADVVAIVVFSLQIIVAVLLALNVRPLIGLALGATMNVAFILSGAVNPSVFYLVLAAAVVVWRMEGALATSAVRRLAMSLTFGAIAVAALLSPEVASLDPADVIEDPALVLLFLYLAVLAATWVVVARRDLDDPAETIIPATARRPALVETLDARPSIPSTTDGQRRDDSRPIIEVVDHGRVAAADVLADVRRRTGQRLGTVAHARLARRLGVRPPAGEPDATVDARYAVYESTERRFSYTKAWIDRLVRELQEDDGSESDDRSNGRSATIVGPVADPAANGEPDHDGSAAGEPDPDRSADGDLVGSGARATSSASGGPAS